MNEPTLQVNVEQILSVLGSKEMELQLMRQREAALLKRIAELEKNQKKPRKAPTA